MLIEKRIFLWLCLLSTLYRGGQVGVFMESADISPKTCRGRACTPCTHRTPTRVLMPRHITLVLTVVSLVRVPVPVLAFKNAPTFIKAKADRQTEKHKLFSSLRFWLTLTGKFFRAIPSTPRHDFRRPRPPKIVFGTSLFCPPRSSTVG
jgi:hypothetical protein